jgi:predicted nucleotidyltransferase
MAFDTSLLDKARAEQQEERERLRQQTLAATFDLLDQMGAKFGVKQAFVFGSVVKPGRFHEGADVDVAVAALEPAAFFDLMGALSLGLGRDVDLVDLRQCHFADRIRQEGMLWTRKT